jgi:C4-dicarboxylate transporter/malic acid transport protein
MKAEEDVELSSVEIEDRDRRSDHVSLRERLKHFTFAWYASTTSTGGVAFVLSVVPNRISALTTIGTIIFILNLCLFTVITITIIARFTLHPGTLIHSLINPHEGFFFATFWLTLAAILSNTTAYGLSATNNVPWLLTALRISFWAYTICATVFAIGYYYVLFTVRKLVITNVLPGWLLPAFPAMLVGTLASAIAESQPAEHVFPMLVAGLMYQGLGMMLAVFIYSIYFGRLLTSGLPADASRPAMFIAVGPPSFTALAFIRIAQDFSSPSVSSLGSLPGVTNQALIPDVLQILALLAAVFLFMLAFWLFAIALLATIEAIPRNDFHLNWYAYIFPNVGFTIATINIGERLDSKAIQHIGSTMAVILFLLWVLIIGCHIRAVVKRKICWPGRDEDHH